MDKEIKHRIFREWVDGCPNAEYKEKRKELKSRLHITRTVYSNYYRGIQEIPDMALEIIENITGISFDVPQNQKQDEN